MIFNEVRSFLKQNEKMLIDLYELRTASDWEIFTPKMMNLYSDLMNLYQSHRKVMQFCNRHNYDTIAMTVAYKYIDNLSWLNNNEKKPNGEIFKSFVSKYMLKYFESGITPEELWSSRCGTIHQNTYESDHTEGKKKTRYVVFYANMELSREELLKNLNTIKYREDNFVFLRMDKLFDDLLFVSQDFVFQSVKEGKIDTLVEKIKAMPLFYMFYDI